MKNIFIKIFSLILFGVSFFTFAATEIRRFIVDGAQVSFDAFGSPSSLHIRGKSEKINGNIIANQNKFTGKFTVELKEFDTGIAMRNKHMTQKYLEVEKYPQAQIEIDEIDGLNLSQIHSEKYVFHGKLLLHGIQKKLQGEVELTNTVKDKISFKVNFKIDLSNYGIATPAFAGITVADQVKVLVTGNMKQGN